MSEAPAISVVIPAYNRAGSIAAAIESVLRQTVTAIEVIVVDDGSADGTAAAAEGVADPRLRVLRLPANRGAAAARNAGLAAARAPLVAFQDSDDEWLPRKLAVQQAALAAMPGAVAVYCGMLVVTALEAGGGRRAPAYLPAPGLHPVAGDLRAALLRQSLISTQTLMAPRGVLEALGGFDESLPALEDWELAIRLGALGPVALADEPLVLQRFSANSITRGAERLVRARAAIVARHGTAMRAEPGCLPAHARAIAGGWRRLGKRGAALAAARQAVAAGPLDPRNWLALVRAGVGR